MGNKVRDKETCICCSYCSSGYMVESNTRKFFYCETCGERMKCVFCGAERNLRVFEEGNFRFVECRVCREKFWDENFDNQPDDNETKMVEKEVKSSRDLQCTKCSSFNVLRSENNANCYKCLICQTEFLDEVSSSIDRLKLITDKKVIQKYASNLFSTCPQCKSEDITPYLNGVKCRQCGASWHPCPDHLDNDDDGFLDNDFWNQHCPRCLKRHGKIVRMPTGRLNCLVCDFSWVPEKIKIQNEFADFRDDDPGDDDVIELEDDDSYLDDGDRYDTSYYCDYDHSIDVRSKTLCPVCSNGYIMHGRCARCGAKMKSCEVCSEPFEDGSQTSGRCEKCSDKEPKGLVCVHCKNVEPIRKADLYYKCSCCEAIQSVDVSKIIKNKRKGQSHDVDEKQFQRYLEYRDTLASGVDEMMEAVQGVQDSIYEGSHCAESFSQLEDLLQQICDIQNYIATGVGEDEDEDELWSREKDRWSDFDCQQKIYSSSDYSDVTITDAGGDLLEDELCFFYEDEKKDLTKCVCCGKHNVRFGNTCEDCFCIM